MARLRIAAAAATIAGFFAAFVAGAGLMAVRWGEDPAPNARGVADDELTLWQQESTPRRKSERRPRSRSY